jgi:hypothetical protein
MIVLHYVFSRSYDLEGCVAKFLKLVLCYGKGPKKVLNFLLCIPEGSEVQSQSLAVGCAPLSLPVPFFYRKILSVMIHHWITLVIHMFFSIELLVGYKRKLNFLYKVIPHGKVFSEFLTKYFVGCLQCHQSLYACL